MKKLCFILFALLIVVSVSVFAVSAEEAVSTTSEASEVSVEESKDESSTDEMGVDLNFDPAGFGRNLKYMGLGMLGIFVVVGVVILLTFMLNSVTGKKKD